MPHIPTHQEVSPETTARVRGAIAESEQVLQRARAQQIPTITPPQQQLTTITGDDFHAPSVTPQPAPLAKAPPIPEVPKAEKELPIPEGVTEAERLIKEIRGFREKEVGRAEFRTAEEERLGIAGLRKTQRDLSSQLQAIQAEIQVTPLQIQKEFEGRGVTRAGVEPIQTGRLRELGIKSLITSANLKAAQDDVAAALDDVDRAIAAKFDPIKERIDVDIANLDLILKSPEFTRQQKERAEKQKDIKEAKKERTKKEEEEQKEIWETGVDASKGGVDAVTLRSIQNAKTKEEALRLASPFLREKKEKYQFQTLTFEDEFGNKTQRIVALDQTTGAQVGVVGVGGTLTSVPPGQKVSTDGGEQIKSPLLERFNTEQKATVLAYAQQYASTGKIPTGMPKWVTFGTVAQIAKELPKQEGTIVDVNTNTKPDISDAKIDGLAAVYDILQKTEQLKNLQKEIVSGVVGGTFGKIFGSRDQQRYLDLRTEIIDLLSRARTGAALTTQEEQFYTNQLPGRFTEAFFLGARAEDRLDNFESKLKGSLDTKLKANGAAVIGFSTVKLEGKEYKVGEIIEVNGIKGRVLPDGSIALIQ